MKNKTAITTISAASMIMSLSAQADVCPALGRLAEKIMDNRQAGHSMSKQLTALEGSTLSDAVKPIVVLSYETPKFNSPAYKQEAVTEFGNEIMLACYKGEITL